jgi:hypothetical protein
MPDLDQIKQGKQGARDRHGGRQGRMLPAGGPARARTPRLPGGVAFAGMGAPGSAGSTTDRGGFAADLLQMQQDEIIDSILDCVQPRSAKQRSWSRSPVGQPQREQTAPCP